MFRVSTISSLSAVVAFVLSAAMVNHGLVDSMLPNGPGLTLDESFNIDQGVYLVDAIEQHGPLIFTPAVAREVFGSKRYLPDHPPLGRVLLGMAHQLTSWAVPGSEESAYNVPAARLGSCVAFAMTVLLLCEFARRKYGETAGVCTALMLIGMPHLMGHARIAALESATNLAWVAAMLPLLAWWTDTKPPSIRQALISGGLGGLLLLTKVQGIFVPPIVFLWAVWQFRTKAVLPLAVWGFAGLIVFSCWPWVWQDPLSNMQAYLGRTTERIELYCWYFGHRYADKSVPWHFPIVMVLVSLPAWMLAGLGLRIVKGAFDSAEKLLVAFAIFPLMVFSIPAFAIPLIHRSFKGVPVYDGTRLFLVVFPPIALLGARGISLWLVESLKKRNEIAAHRPSAFGVRASLVAIVGVASLYWTMQPLTISQYGPLLLGNRGASAAGMESCYWSEALNTDFWKRVPENSTVYVAPVSHQFQLSDLESLVPIVQQRNIRLLPYKYDRNEQKGLLLLIHRLADLRVSLRTVPEGAEVVAEVTRDGIVMARLIDTTDASLPDPLE